MRTHTDPISTEDMIAEAKLELMFRASTYAKLVSQGKMRQDVADFRTRRMQGILDRLQGDLVRERRERGDRETLQGQGELAI